MGSRIRNSRSPASTVVRATSLLSHFTPDRPSLTLAMLQRMSAMPSEENVILVEKVTDSPDAVPRTQVGSPIPAHATALGKALLALMPIGKREDFVSSSLRTGPVRTEFSTHRLRRELAEVALRLWAGEADQSPTGYWCPAAPIRFDDGQIAAISLAASHDRPLGLPATMGLRRAAVSIPQALR